MPKATGRLRIVRKAVEDFSDTEIEKLMDFGRREADLLEEMEAAVRTGDRELVWQLAKALVEIEDQSRTPPGAA
jgi:hypothetical protein